MSGPEPDPVLAVYDTIGLDGAHPPGGLDLATGERLAQKLGYLQTDLDGVPRAVREAFVGAAALSFEVDAPGTVADLGCGSGVDSWILAGRGHRVVALDASGPMLTRLARGGREHPEPHPLPVRGLLPQVPLADESVRWVLLNGVANIVPDRAALLREVARILVPGGGLRVADLVAVGEIPAEIRNEPEARAWCVAGAVSPETWRNDLARAGFAATGVELLESFPPLARALVRATKETNR